MVSPPSVMDALHKLSYHCFAFRFAIEYPANATFVNQDRPRAGNPKHIKEDTRDAKTEAAFPTSQIRLTKAETALPASRARPTTMMNHQAPITVPLGRGQWSLGSDGEGGGHGDEMR